MRRFLARALATVIAGNVLVLTYSGLEKGTEATIRDDWVIEGKRLLPESADVGQSAILIHGFTGSPFDMKPLAETLAKSGFSVIVPCLPFQTKKDFAYSRRGALAELYVSDLRRLIDEETQSKKKKPIVIGFSMGAAIAMAAWRPDKVDKLVFVSPHFELPVLNELAIAAAKGLRYVFPVTPKFVRSPINDPQGLANYTPGSHLISIDAFLQVVLLAEMAVAQLENISVPILVATSTGDRTSSHVKTRELMANMKSVNYVEFRDSNHQIFYDYDSDSLLARIVTFLQAE